MVGHSLGVSGGPGRRTQPSHENPNKTTSWGRREDAAVTEPDVLEPPLAGLQSGRGSHAHLHTRVHTRTPQGMLPFYSVATDPQLTHLRLL